MCNGPIDKSYIPMSEWKMEGPICGNCYSKKIHDHYPGDHVRVNLSDKE